MEQELSRPYRREDHENACPCKLCVTFDIAFAMQETGATGYDLPRLHANVTRQRERKLNWNLPDGHCLLCGGTAFNTWAIKDHYEIPRHNTKEVLDRTAARFYTSLLLHKDGAMFAVYKSYVERSRGWATLPFQEAKRRFIEWASQLMDLSPAKCIGVASRDIGDWVEIRLGYTELVEENREQRIARFIREAGEGRAQTSAGAGATGQV